MPIHILMFQPEHITVLRSFMQQYKQHRALKHPETEEFYTWMLEKPVEHYAYLAFDNDTCVGILRFFRRQYRNSQQTFTGIEPFDWHVLPEYRQQLAGLHLKKRLMSLPEPIISLGGSEITVNTLAALGWQNAQSASHYKYPVNITSNFWIEKIHRKLPLAPRPLLRHILRAAAVYFHFRPVKSRPDWKTIPVSIPGDEVLSLYAGEIEGTVQVPHLEHWRWLISEFSGNGQFITLYYLHNDRLRGWAVGRILQKEDICLGQLIELFSPQSDRALYTWMLSELMQRLHGFQPDYIYTETSCPYLQAALVNMRFLRLRDIPFFTWRHDKTPLPQPMRITQNTMDHPFLPQRNTWFINDKLSNSSKEIKA
jgi:hypothetical protein